MISNQLKNVSLIFFNLLPLFLSNLRIWGGGIDASIRSEQRLGLLKYQKRRRRYVKQQSTNESNQIKSYRRLCGRLSCDDGEHQESRETSSGDERDDPVLVVTLRHAGHLVVLNDHAHQESGQGGSKLLDLKKKD